jgi:hypothetical protein
MPAGPAERGVERSESMDGGEHSAMLIDVMAVTRDRVVSTAFPPRDRFSGSTATLLEGDVFWMSLVAHIERRATWRNLERSIHTDVDASIAPIRISSPMNSVRFNSGSSRPIDR